MPAAIRRAQILERIRREGGASVAELARVHDVSSITVHRDLERLADEGLVERIHGGARALEGEPDAIETDWTQRLRSAWPAKEAIAAQADAARPLGYRETPATKGLLKRPSEDMWGDFTCLLSLRDVEPAVNLVLQDARGLDQGREFAPRPPEPQE